MRSVHDQALKLVESMTVEEKVAQLCAAWLEISEDGSFSVKEIAFRDERPRHDRGYVLGHGVGQLTRPYGTQPKDPRLIAKGVNDIQRYLVNETRLGIPAMLHEECLAGAMVQGCTSFPSSLNYASTWDDGLMERIARVINRELTSLGVHQGLAPVLDVARDARWGRLEETFGEDPYLAGCMGIAYVRGLQGSKNSPLATLKHFTGHAFSEGGRNHAPVHIGERELLNTFALPFEMVVKAARPGAVMPAYHDIDGVPCSSSGKLVNDLLRGEWGFDGLVVADYEGVSQLCTEHHVAADLAEAAALALRAGMDIELPSSTAFKEGLTAALDRGLVEMAEVDQAVMRVLTEKIRLGIFEHPYVDIEGITLSTREHHELAVEAAVKSIVLLKNDGILPLSPQHTVAMIGPLADHPYAMFGGYSTPVHLQGISDPVVTVPQRARSVRRAVEELLGPDRVIFEPGCKIYENRFNDTAFFPGEVKAEELSRLQLPSTDTSRIPAAVQAAGHADAVILVVGDMVGLFQNGTVGEGSDVSTLRLPGVQQQLLDALIETGKPVVLLLVSGRPYDLGAAADKVSAIAAAWLPGEGGGEAAAGILFGRENPGGKTPLSFPLAAGAMPYTYNHTPKAGGLPKQRDFGARYPFGYGLSYTSFSCSSFILSSDAVPVDGKVSVSCVVENTGNRPGDEVLQLYVRDTCSSIVRPVKELKGYARISLQPGAQRKVTFTVPVDMFSFIHDGRRIVEPGSFTVMVGTSSEHILWSSSITVTGELRVLTTDWRFTSTAHVEPLEALSGSV